MNVSTCIKVDVITIYIFRWEVVLQVHSLCKHAVQFAVQSPAMTVRIPYLIILYQSYAAGNAVYVKAVQFAIKSPATYHSRSYNF